MLLKRILSFDGLFFVFASYLIVKGLLNKEDSFITAETGLGYMLGIVGGSMMLVLLLYPLRKHVRLLRSLGPVRYWFRLHMLLGVAGPVLVLYHANFSMGSTNSNVALICMLIVAGSGLFGRLFYSRIHEGLYGRKIEFGELRETLSEARSHLDELDNDIGQRLQAFETKALKQRSLLSALLTMPFIHLRAAFVRRRVQSKIKSIESALSSAISRQQLKQDLDLYFKKLVRIADFTMYERLFSLWHVLHIPLFFMMIISGIVHVIAVHIY